MKELLFSVTKKEFEVTWFSGKGAGGQHRNKHQNCCRIVHPESGAMGVGQNQRSRMANQKDAFENLVNSKIFQNWLKIKLNRMIYDYSELDRKIDKELEKLRVEYFENGRWVEQ